jgi:hypothetical protein
MVRVGELVRIKDWELRLQEVVARVRSRPFSWAEMHCGGFAAACVDAMTGSRFADQIGGFDGAYSAARWVRLEGGLVAAVTRRLGEPIYALAELGDVVQLDSGQPEWVEALGVATRYGVMAPGHLRLEYRPLAVARVWRIPHG